MGEIRLNCSLNTKKNYIFIDDLAYLLRVIGPYGKKNFYNIGSNNMISNNEIVEKLVKLTNCNIYQTKMLKQFLSQKSIYLI